MVMAFPCQLLPALVVLVRQQRRAAAAAALWVPAYPEEVGALHLGCPGAHALHQHGTAAPSPHGSCPSRLHAELHHARAWSRRHAPPPIRQAPPGCVCAGPPGPGVWTAARLLRLLLVHAAWWWAPITQEGCDCCCLAPGSPRALPPTQTPLEKFIAVGAHQWPEVCQETSTAPARPFVGCRCGGVCDVCVTDACVVWTPTTVQRPNIGYVCVIGVMTCAQGCRAPPAPGAASPLPCWTPPGGDLTIACCCMLIPSSW